MPRFIKKSNKKAGSAPGTLVHVGEQKTENVHISLIDYTSEHIQEQKTDRIEDLLPLRNATTNTWINIDGIHDLDFMKNIGPHFGIHPLTLEDIVNTAHRPKTEEFDTYVYIVLKMLHYDDNIHMVVSEQVSLVLGAHFLLTFQEAPGDVFAPVRDRLHKGKGQLRQRGCDYLAYALIDAIVDHYFYIMEKMGDRLETLEEHLTDHPEVDVIQQIHGLKREVIYLRKQVWPMREVLSRLSKGEFDLVQAQNHIFWGDVYDHIVQLMDTIESYRDVLSGMLDLYLSTISNRMNQVMKVLTIVATIFIPITFIAGVYGMNFKHMPELEWPWGYGAIWGFMIAIVVIMVIYFRKNKWL
ncbi:MAG: magnesium/cobalt transporter CorA [Desulfobacteraceae bacterium]|jgi:magnesium transporter